MDNKFYVKLKKIIKENKVYIITFIIFFILLNIHLPWNINAPGGLVNVDERFTGDTNKNKGTMNLTYVTFIRGNIPSIIVSFIMPNWDLVHEEDYSITDEEFKIQTLRDRMSLKESVSNATYLAYTKANKKIEISNTEVYVNYIFDEAETDLQIGDQIISVDNKEIANNEDLINEVKNKKIDDNITMKVKRKNKEINVSSKLVNINDEPKIGIALSVINDYKKEPDIKYHYRKSESGSSGGLMLTLAMYNALIKEDITKGKTISGTGTIDMNGNVGEIAGIKYKLAGAVKNKSDVFIVPEDNYKEAIKEKKKNKYKIKIIKATTFDQVIESLKKLEK